MEIKPSVWFAFYIALVAADPGRDMCKMHNDGLKCTGLMSQYFPYDLFLSFNDDVADFTTDMKSLEIRNSNITVLQFRSFQRMTQISRLILSRISLSEIEHGAFDGLRGLKFVDLSYNSLAKVPVDAFKQTKIHRLDLEGNTGLVTPEIGPILSAKHMRSLTLRNCQIRRLSESAFSELPALAHLDLSANLLKSLPPRSFTWLEHLSSLDLSQNQFSTLDVDVFRSIKSFPKHPKFVALENNPWVCDCSISQLSLWATRNWENDTWTEEPGQSRLGKSVTCLVPNGLTWNSEKFQKLMSSC